ncbi:MAG: right-handed parallel beta-helix repeat-containing protein [Bacteroidales bacterium]|nr:right-handed parallel beta-helix repeat-containing protein [Bacteroidales bacterium]
MNTQIRKTQRAIALLLCLVAAGAQAQVSVATYLDSASSDANRYRALLAAHRHARETHTTVNYAGVDTLYLEIPADAEPIPLADTTDFGGLTIYVRNNAKHISLFAMSAQFATIELTKIMVDSGQFGTVPQLATGLKLLLLTDAHPWTYRNMGSKGGYTCYRKDILLLSDGQAANSPISPYNTDSTQLQCSWTAVTATPKLVANLTMHRLPGSQYRTNCVALNGQNNVTLRNITVTTPKSKLIADGIFSISNCTNITVEDVTVDGTYSGYGRYRHYGYAFSMNNDWNTLFRNVVADGNWGVFGTNNLSLTTLDSCDVNRFDIHCYGRDARMVRCTLRNKQTQFSSMFGTVVYDSCNFVDCIPLRIRSSYNAYTPFDVVMRHCTFETTLRYHSLINFMMLDTAENIRPELAEKCYPNVDIDDLTITVPAVVRKVNIFDPTGTMSELVRPYGHISHVRANSVRLVTPSGKPSKARLNMSSKPVVTKKYITIDIQTQ